MSKGHVVLLVVGLILASATFKLLPRFTMTSTPTGVVFTYDKWSNQLYVCYANGCRKADDLTHVKGGEK